MNYLQQYAPQGQQLQGQTSVINPQYGSQLQGQTSVINPQYGPLLPEQTAANTPQLGNTQSGLFTRFGTSADQGIANMNASFATGMLNAQNFAGKVGKSKTTTMVLGVFLFILVIITILIGATPETMGLTDETKSWGLAVSIIAVVLLSSITIYSFIKSNK